MPMRCEVLLFAQARELAGRDRLSLSLPDGATVAEAVEAAIAAHPGLASLRNRLAVAVDQRYVASTAPLRNGCTLALIPPVSGG